MSFIISPNEQGSPLWLQGRLGVITASQAECVVAGASTAKRATYMLELIAEVCTGQAAEISAKPLEWGRQHEHSARTAYELMANAPTRQVGFIWKDAQRRTGCSPDGLIEGARKGLELKCPYASKTHVEFLIDGHIRREYVLQVQFSMWITGYELWDFASYDHRVKARMLHWVTLERDPKLMALFDDAVPQFIHEMDEKLRRIPGAGFRNFVTNFEASDGAVTVEGHHPQE